MAKRIPEEELQAIEEVVRRHQGGVTAQQIAAALQSETPLRTLQYRLKFLVTAGRLAREGEGRWTTYHPPAARGGTDPAGAPEEENEALVPISAAGVPLETRKVLLGHKTGDITTHYSAPELEELISAADRVCSGKSGTRRAARIDGSRRSALSSCYGR